MKRDFDDPRTPSPASHEGGPPELGPSADEERGDRDRFDASEAARVLSHFDVGVIHEVREYPRGSRRSPKLRIAAAAGEFLLKRRAPGRDQESRVTFAHEVQAELADAGYPVAGLVPTRSTGTPFLQLAGRVYELFHFVPGEREDGTPAAAVESGRALGRLHGILAGHHPPAFPPASTYHGAPGLGPALRKVPDTVAAVAPQAPAEVLEKRCRFLGSAYREAAARVETLGFGRWPTAVVHGDWHPGNLLYQDGRVAAVLDFDAARMETRTIDVANGALQFSMMVADPHDPDTWPDRLDVKRIQALLSGYHQTGGPALTTEELEALPWLILEALILETVVPVAATGTFAGLGATSFLGMVERKVRWLKPRAARLTAFLAEHLAELPADPLE